MQWKGKVSFQNALELEACNLGRKIAYKRPVCNYCMTLLSGYGKSEKATESDFSSFEAHTAPLIRAAV